MSEQMDEPVDYELVFTRGLVLKREFHNCTSDEAALEIASKIAAESGVVPPVNVYKRIWVANVSMQPHIDKTPKYIIAEES